jgi:hypothetical protein
MAHEISMKARLAYTALALLLGCSAAPPSSADIPQVFLICDTRDWSALPCTGDPFVGERTLYLESLLGAPNRWMSRIEFSLVSDFEVVSITPATGWHNLGVGLDVILELDDSCVEDGPLLEIVVRDPLGEGGSICLGEHSATSRICVKCDRGIGPPDWYYLTHVTGYSTSSDPSCSLYPSGALCQPVAIQRAGWGMVKARYHTGPSN